MNSLERDVIQGLGCIVFLLYNISEQATKEALVFFFPPLFFLRMGWYWLKQDHLVPLW